MEPRFFDASLGVFFVGKTRDHFLNPAFFCGLHQAFHTDIHKDIFLRKVSAAASVHVEKQDIGKRRWSFFTPKSLGFQKLDHFSPWFSMFFV